MDGVEQIEIPDLDAIKGSLPPANTLPPSQKHSDNNHENAKQVVDTNEKPTSEYSLHILFTRFVRLAERKLYQLRNLPDDDIEKLLGQNVDPEFDTVLSSLGRVARRRPKPVIDSFMYWRKSKRDSLNDSLASLFVLCRALMEIVKQTPHEALGDGVSEKLEEIVFNQLTIVDASVAESRGIAGANWRYLARLLGEMSSRRLESINDRFLAELERPVKSKQDELRVQVLLETMQYLKLRLYPEEFLEENSLFVESLAKFYARTPINSSLRSHYANAIANMLEPLSESISVEVNQPVWASSMLKLFTASQESKSGNSSLISNISNTSSQPSLHPETPIASLSVVSLCLAPRPMFSENWLKLIDLMTQKSRTKLSKNIKVYPQVAKLFWVYIFRYSESLNLTTKKIETIKLMFLSSTNRKYWQLFDSISSLTFRNACISLLESAFQGYQQYTLDNVLFPMLVGNDSTSVSQQHAISFDQSVIPERAAISIDAFIRIINQLRAGERPPFPTTKTYKPDDLVKLEERDTKLPYTPVVSEALQTSIDLFGSCIGQITIWLAQNESHPDVPSRQNSVTQLVTLSTTEKVEYVYPSMGLKNAEERLLLVCVQSWPSWWTSEKHSRYLEVLCFLVSSKNEEIRLAASNSLKQLFETCDLRTIVKAFTKTMMTADTKVAEGATTTSSASAGNGQHFRSNSEPRFRSNSEPRFRSNSIDQKVPFLRNTPTQSQSPTQLQSTLPQPHLLTYLELYIEMIEKWIKRLQNGDPQIVGNNVDVQLLSLWSVVEEIEGNGLFFLCSQDLVIRSSGLRILWLANAMDQAIMNYKESHANANASVTSKSDADTSKGDTSKGDTSTRDMESDADGSKPVRVINLLNDVPIYQIVSEKFAKTELSTPLKSRLSKFKSKRASLARLAESTYGLDNALWLKLFPFIIKLCFETHPIPIAFCRNTITDRLIQMHDIISQFALQQDQTDGTSSTSSTSGAGGNGGNGGSGVLERLALIEQWKIYLIFACATITSTEDQKIHVPKPSLTSFPNHIRKRSQQKITLHHHRIVSVKSVFKIVLPLLESESNLVWEAVTSGLSYTSVNTFKTLLECLRNVFNDYLPDIGKTPTALRVVLGVTHILKQTARFLNDKSIRQDIWIRTELVRILQQLRDVLNALPTLNESLLRVLFCELLANTYTALGPTLMFTGRDLATEWFSMWATIEKWSPYGTNSKLVLENRAILRRRATTDVMLAQLEVFKRNLDRASSKALASLLADSQSFIKDLQPVLKWVHLLLSSNVTLEAQEVGRTALENLLVNHASRPELLHEVVIRCYHNSSEKSRLVAKVYFVALVNKLESNNELIQSKVEKPQQFLALALFKIGDPDCETRFKAVKLIELVENGLYGDSMISGEYQFRLRSSSPSVYKREIFVLSGRLASQRSQESFYLFSQLTRAFQAVNDNDRKDILSVLLPWIQNIEFEDDNELGFQMVIVNLLEITTLFSAKMQHEVEALWIALCTNKTGTTNNALKILEFLLSFCMRQRTQGAVSVSRTVLIYLLTTPSGATLTEQLLKYIEPGYMITQNGGKLNKQGKGNLDDLVSPECSEKFPYVATLNEIVNLADEQESHLKTGKSVVLPPFSYAQLAVIFLVDTISASTPVRSKVASLIHACVVMADHFVPLINDKSRELILNLAGMLNPEPTKMCTLTDQLESHKWKYEELSESVPDQLYEVVNYLAKHFSSNDQMICLEWSRVAIHWATTTNVRHIACRSLQVFRCLDYTLDEKLIGDLLARLSNTISENSLEIQAFATQILMTLNANIDKLSAEELIQFPSLFWAAVASLTTCNCGEYIEGLAALSNMLSKWTPEFCVNVLQSFPPKWEEDLEHYEGLIPLVTQGLKSQKSAETSHTVLNQLIMLAESPTEEDKVVLFGGKDPLGILLASSLPWFLQALEQPHTIVMLTPSANSLYRLVYERSGSLSRVLDSFVKRRFWSRWDFLRQFVLALPTSFPDDVDDTIILFLAMSNNSTKFIRKTALDVLATLIPEANIHSSNNGEIVAGRSRLWSNSGADVIAPLLRLLSTSEVDGALNVLDIISTVHPNERDRDILRMTLGSKQVSKEYENTETLFGIPDESGWSVPLPLNSRNMTQANIHAVFYLTVQGLNTNYNDIDFFDNEAVIPEFQSDEFIPLEETTNLYSRQQSVDLTAQSEDATMDKILTDLDEFDSFFTRVAAPQMDIKREPADVLSNNIHQNRHPTHNASGSVGNAGNQGSSNLVARTRAPSEVDSIPQLYDKQVSQILNQSLARSTSQVSFRTTFADLNKAPMPTPPPPSGTQSGTLSANTSTTRPYVNPSANSTLRMNYQDISDINGRHSETHSNRSSMVWPDRRSMSILDSNLEEEDDNADAFSFNSRRSSNFMKDSSLDLSRKQSIASDVSPKQSNSSRRNTVSSEDGKTKISESSFRLEGLVRGKSKQKQSIISNENDDDLKTDIFQFPPR